MIGVIFGILLGFLIIYILFTIWDYIDYTAPIDIDEKDACSDPIFDVMKCPKCYCYEYEVSYVDPLFNKGKYARCKACGWTWDLDEDDSQGIFER